MTIWIPSGLPAAATLRAEGIEVNNTHGSNSRSRILRIAMLNLMPQKAETETQFARVLGDTGRGVDLTLFVPDGYQPRHTPRFHVERFYLRWDDVRRQRFDGLIVTGAPVEMLDFEDIDYWSELARILDWARHSVRSTICICWAAQAALYHFHGVTKCSLPRKLSGIFTQRVTASDHPLLAGFQDTFQCPVSRHTEVRRSDLPQTAGLEVLADSPESGLSLVEDRPNRTLYMFNHLEYQAGTLREEYERDCARGQDPDLPKNYFPANDATLAPENRWQPAARQLFTNWMKEIEAEAARPAAHRQAPDRSAAIGPKTQIDAVRFDKPAVCALGASI